METEGRYFTENIYCTLEGRTLRVANLSPGGLFAATSRLPDMGQTVVLELHLSRRDSFQIVGEVSWVNRPDAPESHDLPEGFGVRFKTIASPDRDAIVEALKRSDRVLRTRGRRKGLLEG
jgi:Tfp pilus assembly protein PilZ